VAVLAETIQGSFGVLLLKGIFSGWLIALMVWMLGGMKGGQAAIVIIITYIVGLAGLGHIIAGSIEVMYLVLTAAASWADYVGYMIPTLLGNIVGGVSLVAPLNHAQAVAGGGKIDKPPNGRPRPRASDSAPDPPAVIHERVTLERGQAAKPPSER
jgi:formate/nitrite transporter FocA (FNT family)